MKLYVKLLLFPFIVNSAISQQEWKLNNGIIYPKEKAYSLSLREGYLSGLRLGYTTRTDSGWVRYLNGVVQFYNGSSWQTFASSSGSSFDSTRLAYLDKANTFTGTPQTMDGLITNSASVGDTAKEGQGMYIFPHFRNMGVYGANADTRLFIDVSNDGKTFNGISTQALYNPSFGTYRDGSIMLYNNEYYIAYTTYAFRKSQTFSIIKSADLIKWDSVATIQVTSSTNKLVYAPEWYKEGDSVSVFFQMADSSADPYYILYSATATNASLTSWDTPLRCIDTTIVRTNGLGDVAVVKNNSTYYLFSTFISPAGNSPLWVFSSSSKRSGYTVFDTTGLAGTTGSYNEGTSIVKINDTTYRAYYEKYSPSSIYYYTESADTFQTWSTPVAVKMGMPYPKHGTVLRVQDISAMRNTLASAKANGGIWSSKSDSTAYLWFGGGTPTYTDFNSTYGYGFKYVGADSLRGSTGSTTYWNHSGYHSGLGASYFGNSTFGTGTFNGAVSATTGTFSGNMSFTAAGTSLISKSTSNQIMQLASESSTIRGGLISLYGGTNANEGLVDIFFGNRDSTTSQLGGSFRVRRSSDGTSTTMFQIDNLGRFYNRSTVFMDSTLNITNIKKVTSDSVTVNGKFNLTGITTDSTTCAKGGIWLKVSDGSLHVKF